LTADRRDEFAKLARVAARHGAAMRAGALGFHARFTEHSALVLTGEAHRSFNTLLVGAEPVPVRFLEECLETARERGCPLTVRFTPRAAEALAADAPRLGLAPLGQMPLMTLRPKSAFDEADDCTIERAPDRATIGRTVTMLAQEMGIPADPLRRVFDPDTMAARGLNMFVALKDGAVVSTVTIMQAAGVAGIWAMATAPDHRRRGHGRALLAKVINGYRERGIARFYLHASEAGRPLYESLGFETVGSYSVWELG
jgi:GNAT superfamily N-acetyltransferase